jgi:hypothetical protein
MAGKEVQKNTGVTRLGSQPEGRVQRYFCVDDEECRAFSMLSHEATEIRRSPKTIRVMGKDVSGWEVEILVPATDGVVRMDPMEDPAKI